MPDPIVISVPGVPASMLIIGADISTRRITLAGVTPDDEWCFAEVPLRKATIPGRGVRQALRVHLAEGFWDSVSLIWIEEPYYNRTNPKTYAALSSVKGALADAIHPRITVDTILPAEWRTELGMPHNAKRDVAKALSRQWCLDHGLPADQLTEDQCDAACIAYVALSQCTQAADSAGCEITVSEAT